jgi:hypothetical protein
MPALSGRRDLSAAEVGAVNGPLTGHTPLVDPARFNRLVAALRTDEPVDPYWVVSELANCSDAIAALLRTDVALWRPCRLHEHTQGVLAGFERDYLRFFPRPRPRMLMRLTLLLQDIGTSLCAYRTGSRLEQAVDNERVSQNLLGAIWTTTLGSAEATAVQLLLGQDVLGGALQGRLDSAALEALREAWPASLAAEFDDMLLVAYLADASAHTAHRFYRDADTLEVRRCVGPDVPPDERLEWLFEPGPGGRLGLRVPAHRQIVRALLNLTSRQIAALVPVPTIAAMTGGTAARVEYSEVAGVPGAWSAELRLGPVTLDEVRERLRACARDHGFPIVAWVRTYRDLASALTLVRTVEPGRNTPTIADYERVVNELLRTTSWRRVQSAVPTSGFIVAIRLREGGLTYQPYEALAELLTRTLDWRTTTALLVSARPDGGRVELDQEPGFVISAGPGYLPLAVDLAGHLRVDRLTVTDSHHSRTYTLARSDGTSG